jgi:hypothetical protein
LAYLVPLLVARLCSRAYFLVNPAVQLVRYVQQLLF